MITFPFQSGGFGRVRTPSTGNPSPGAHKYWRLLVTLTQDASFAGVTELILRNSAGVDVSTGDAGPSGKAGSSEINGANSAVRAFDANIVDSGWISANPVPQWIAVDVSITHGSDQEIKTFDIYGSWNLPASSPRNFQLQWSDDFVSWTTAQSYTGQVSWGANQLRTFNVF